MSRINARLFCKTGALAGSEYRIDEEATIGRREQNDITLPPDAVSGRHARIFFDDEKGCYVLEDLDSSNGTQLDDTKVIEPVPLKDLHIITFAQKVDFIFQAVGEEAAASSGEEEAKTQFGTPPEAPAGLPGEDEPEGDRTRIGEQPPELPDLPEGEDETEPDERTRIGGMAGPLPDLPTEEEPSEDEGEGEEEHTRVEADAPALPDLPENEPSSEEEEEGAPEEAPSLSEAPTRAAPSQMPQPAESSPQYTLQVILESGPQGTYDLPEGEVTLGRSPDCDIQIDDPGVSREHARLVVEADEVVVEDMGSKNFTFVNGDRLTGPTAIAPGAEIHIGLQVKAVLRRAS